MNRSLYGEFGYKKENDGNIWFSWVFINKDQKTLWLSGILGEVHGEFLQLGDDFTPDNFESKTIPMLEGLNYMFDFNDKCIELLLRFSLANINDLYNFRFQRIEPLINSALQRSGNGFCDNGYCDEEYLNLVLCVYSIEHATKTISTYLPKVLGENEINFSVWVSDKGVAKERVSP